MNTSRRFLFSELSLWIMFAGLCLYYLYPLRSSLRFGSDLVGGVYLTLAVQTEEAVEADLVNKMGLFVSNLKKSGKSVTKKSVKNQVIELEFATAQEAQEAARLAKSDSHTSAFTRVA